MNFFVPLVHRDLLDELAAFFLGLKIPGHTPRIYKKYFDPNRHRFKLNKGDIDLGFTSASLLVDGRLIDFAYEVPSYLDLPGSFASGDVDLSINLSGERSNVKKGVYSEMDIIAEIDGDYSIFGESGNLKKAYESQKIDISLDGFFKIEADEMRVNPESIEYSYYNSGSNWTASYNIDSNHASFYKSSKLIAEAIVKKDNRLILRFTSDFFGEIGIIAPDVEFLFEQNKFKFSKREAELAREELDRIGALVSSDVFDELGVSWPRVSSFFEGESVRLTKKQVRYIKRSLIRVGDWFGIEISGENGISLPICQQMK